MGPKDRAIDACGPDDLVVAMTYPDSMRQFYYVVPRSEVVAWYLAQPVKRHHELVRGPCKLALDLDGGADFTAAFLAASERRSPGPYIYRRERA